MSTDEVLSMVLRNDNYLFCTFIIELETGEREEIVFVEIDRNMAAEKRVNNWHFVLAREFANLQDQHDHRLIQAVPDANIKALHIASDVRQNRSL